MPKVVALPGYDVPLAPGQPDMELVETLEKLLEEARNGHLLAMTYATYRSTGEVGWGWKVGRFRHEIAAGVIMLQYSFAKALVED